MKQACDGELWKAKILRFKDEVERVTDTTITAPKLEEAIRLANAWRVTHNPLRALSFGGTSGDARQRPGAAGWGGRLGGGTAWGTRSAARPCRAC